MENFLQSFKKKEKYKRLIARMVEYAEYEEESNTYNVDSELMREESDELLIDLAGSDFYRIVLEDAKDALSGALENQKSQELIIRDYQNSVL